MNKETEIKLCISQDALLRVREHPLLAKRNKAGWQKVELANQYFDTPERDLAAAHVALRIRRDGDVLIQTLKSRGASIAGLSERNEWDWPLEKAKLDTKKLDANCWPEALAALDKKQLKAAFSTDFIREKAEIAWGRGKSRVVIEAALDVGTVTAGKLSARICELELELREGEVSALLELAAALAADIAVLPCDISKAERGYRLSETTALRTELALPVVNAEASLDDNVPALVGYLLANSQRLAEHYVHTGHWRVLNDWFSSLTDLRALLSSLGQAAPRASTHSLRELLDALIEHWRAFVHAGQTEENVRQQAPARFAQELTLTRWGQFSLICAQWLYEKRWMTERNARGSRQGAATLGNWLAHLLTDEALALQLKRYQQQPEDLAEQLPRIEKMLVWLRLSRNVLDVPEVDRFYGELRKLQELALEPISDELLAARVAQAHTVWTLKAFKALTR